MKPVTQVALSFAALGLAATAGVGVWRSFRKRTPPAVRERRRRLAIHANGRMVDGLLLDLHGDELCYSYTVRGVEYNAAQDISELRDRLPAGVMALIGPAMVKYSPGDPADSIVICEEWSGLRGIPLPAAARPPRLPGLNQNAP